MRTQNRTNNDHRPAPRRAHGLFALILASLSGICAAGETGMRFDQPAQPLAAALDAIARASGLKLLYADAAVRGRQAAPLRGNYTTEEALRAVLGDSGLRYEFVGENMVAVKNGPESETPDTADTAPTALPEMTVTASPLDQTSYNVPNATTATKTDTPIMETPVSIQVVPQQVLEDQQAILVKDALKNVSGVFWTGDFQYDGFQLRGFINNDFTTVYRNGLRLARAKNEVANLEQIEVLKGPAAALYGRINPGGLINLVTKKPLTEPYYSLEQQLGSFDLYRTALEATGPLTADRSLLYGFNLVYKNNDTFIDFVDDDERVFVAPALTWRPSERTEINLNLEYQHDDNRYYGGIPALGRRPAPIPIGRYLGFGADEDQEFETFDKTLVGFDWSHAFNDDWKLTNRFHYYFYDYVFNNTWFGVGVADDGRSFMRGLYHFPLDLTHTYATNIDLTGKFETFGMNHQVLVGLDYFREDFEAEGFSDVAPPAFRPTIDIFNPVYGPIPQLSRSEFNTFSSGTDYWYGVYFQNQITLWDKLHLLGGGRYDWATSRFGSSSVSLAEAEASESQAEDEAFSPRVGLVYQPWPWLALYGNYVESFGTNNGRSMTGQPFDPETAQQYETGFKTEVLDRRLTSTVAFYHLTKQNVLTRDPLNPAFSIPIGEARSRGIEVDIAGQLTDNLSLIATYALTDPEITKDNFGNQGNRFFNIPEHAGSIFAKYEFHNSYLTGLSLGAGAFFVGQRECDNENTCELPGYGRVDVFAAYKWKLGPTRLTAQLNINNLLDKTYFESAGYGGRGGLIPGAPRSFFGLARVEF